MCNVHLIKIGYTSKNRGVLHDKHKKYGMHKPPQLKVCYLRLVKLIRRDLGNVINNIIVHGTTSACNKHHNERQSSLSR